MKITSANLEVSAVRRSQYPTSNLPEFLLVGRSNVGKSSFVNSITNRKKLARISATPGKTRNLNFYLINEEFYFVDVFGYGYASLGKKEQKKFGLMIEDYLEKREQLKKVYLLVDLRHKPSDDDVLMYKFLKYYNLPVTVVATKADKVSNSRKIKCEKTIRQVLQLDEEDNLIVFSSLTREGKDKILKEIESLIYVETQ